MNILVVVNDLNELDYTVKCLRTLYPDATLIQNDDAMDAVRYGFNNPVDVVYTELVMKLISGFTVARLLKKVQPEVQVHFIANDKQYLPQAISKGMVGYYLKPINPETLLHGNLIDCPVRSPSEH